MKNLRGPALQNECDISFPDRKEFESGTMAIFAMCWNG
jgi:hypothetical protein